MTRVARPVAPRRGLEFEAMLGAAVEIECFEIAGEAVRQRRIDRRAAVLADQPLRLHVRGARIIAAHALEHLQEIGAAVLRVRKSGAANGSPRS